MSAILQVSTIAGRFIDARWEVSDIANLREGQGFRIGVVSKDRSLLEYIGRSNNTDCYVDQTEDGESTIILSCMIKQIKHMFEIGAKSIESMAVLVPSNRVAENVLIYALSPEKADPRFAQLLKAPA